MSICRPQTSIRQVRPHDMSVARRRLPLASLCGALMASLLAMPVFAQSTAPGGFLETTSSTQVRSTAVPSMPSRGPFTFPAPYATTGVRITNSTDCAGADCVDYIGYSYWRNTNYHVGSNTMLIFVTLDRSRGGSGPTLFSYDKTTDQVTRVGPLFDASSPFSWATGEGWYWSPTMPTKLYVTDGGGPKLYRYDVNTKQLEVVFDVSGQFGSDKYIWQTHTSNDDKVHSATLRRTGDSTMLGCVVYDENTKQFTYAPKVGDFDECQVDKSGRWLLLKENMDGAYGEDNSIFDLTTGQQTATLLDQQGAAGHSDSGAGYMIAEDNWNGLPGAARVWRLDQPLPGTSPQGLLVYNTTDWNVDLGHVSHANSRAGLPLDQQYACLSHASRYRLPRANEIVCFRLDGSLQVLVVAPVMTDLNAAGGGDDYSKLPKGNLDITGQYFIWTTNLGGNRLDAFIVKVPSQLLVTETGGGGSGSTGDTSAPLVSLSAPTTGATMSGTATVSATATDDVGVAGVQFKLNGVNLGAEVTTAPYSTSWDTTASVDGSYTLTAVARDSAGNTATSSGVTVNVSNSTSGGSTTGGTTVAVSWTNRVHVTATGNSLRKTSGCDGCQDAGAVSVSGQRIQSGNGYLEFTASEATTLRFIGFGRKTTTTTTSELRFAIALRPGGVAEVRESGTYRSDTTYVPGDVFRIKVKNGGISYSKNGTQFYKSTLPPAYPLIVDTALLSLDATITNVMLNKP